LQSALIWLETQDCPVPSGISTPGFAKTSAPLSRTDGIMPKSPWRENRIMPR
jgi:hypothetical protein